MKFFPSSRPSCPLRPCLRCVGHRHILGLATAFFLIGVAEGAAQISSTPASVEDSIRTLERAQRRLRDYTWDIGGVDRNRGWHNDDPARAMYRARQNRPAVIAEMDRAAALIPGDDWIVAQRVGLRVKQGQLADALRVAEECVTTGWWCLALRGFVLHVMQDYPAAEAAFRKSMGSMPHDIRCDWRKEIGWLLNDNAAAAFERAPCSARGSLENQLWWLADPLYLVPGNDRLTAHYARRVFLWFHKQVIPHEPHQIVQLAHVRRGWADWWWSGARPYRNPETTPLPADGVPDLPGFRFIPPAEVLEDPLTNEHGVWGATAPAGLDEERYNPHYGPFHRLDQQTGFLLRDDSLLVVVALNTAIPGLGAAQRVLSGVVLSRGPDDEPLIALDETGPGTQRYVLTVPDDAWLVSVEALATGRGAARARFGHRLPERAGDFGLSDILLFEWSAEAGEVLDDVLPRVLPTTRLERGGNVGIYWEVYGVDEADDVEITLSVTPHESGFLRRLGEALRLVGPRESVGVEWRDAVGRSGVVSRTLRVDLGSLDRGVHTLELSARNAAGASVVARREIEITPEDR